MAKQTPQQLSSVKHLVRYVHLKPVRTLLEQILVALFTLLIRCVECCSIKCQTNGVALEAKRLCLLTLEHQHPFFVQPNDVADGDGLYSRKEHNLPVCLYYFSQKSVFYINLCCSSLLNLPQMRIFVLSFYLCYPVHITFS